MNSDAVQKTEKIQNEKPLGARLGEGFFCVFYLIYTIILVIIMKSRYEKGIAATDKLFLDPMYMDIYRYGFGYLLAALLVLGDAFHLIPRIIVNFRGSMMRQEFFLGLGNLISSITMTVYYNILIALGDTLEYDSSMYNMGVEKAILILTIIRIVLLLLPWNRWYSGEPNRKWAIIRNIPFAIIGILTVYGFLVVVSYARNYPTSFYLTIIITVMLSFIFYLPVAIFGKEKPKLGMLMIPKTICYMVMLSVICFWTL